MIHLIRLFNIINVCLLLHSLKSVVHIRLYKSPATHP